MAAKKKTTTKTQNVAMRPMENRTLSLRLVGDSPLVVHAFGEKSRKQMAAAQSAQPKPKKKPPRDPDAEYESAFYRDVEGRYCLPSICIKKAIATAAARFYDVTKVWINGVVRVDGDTVMDDGMSASLIHYDSVEMNTSTVRLSGISRTADLRYRPMFRNWHMDISMTYDASQVRADDLLEYVRRMGFSVGLCEWRCEKGGEWGYCHIATEDEV